MYHNLIKLLPEAFEKIIKLRNVDEDNDNDDIEDDNSFDDIMDDDDIGYVRYDYNYDSKLMQIDEILMVE